MPAADVMSPSDSVLVGYLDDSYDIADHGVTVKGTAVTTEGDYADSTEKSVDCTVSTTSEHFVAV